MIFNYSIILIVTGMAYYTKSFKRLEAVSLTREHMILLKQVPLQFNENYYLYSV